MNNRLINTKVAGGGGCTDIVDNYDPFGDSSGLALYQLNGDATDVSGNYNGTASNVTYGTGQFGQGASFNTSNSILTTPRAFSTNSPYSVSGWAKIANGSTTQVAYFAWQITGTNQSQVTVGYDGVSTYRLAVNHKFETNSNVNYNFAANDGQWHHYAVTFNGSSANLYIDGSFVKSGLLDPKGDVSSTNYLGGTNIYNGITYYNGLDGIDQVRYFNTALTPLEVEALYTEELCICDGTVDTLDILGDGSCIATYQLDGNANDLSGNYSGTPTNVSYGVGEFDLAGVFNGSSSKITTPLNINNIVSNINDRTQDFSWSVWVNPLEITSDTIIYFGNSTVASPNYDGIYLNFASGNIRAGVYGGAVYEMTTPTSTNTWKHIVFLRDNSFLKLYVNGQFINQVQQLTDTSIAASIDLEIGTAQNSQYFNGSIDQVRIFNKALSAGEVTTLYNETACTVTYSNTEWGGAWDTVNSITSACTAGSSTLSFSNSNRTATESGVGFYVSAFSENQYGTFYLFGADAGGATTKFTGNFTDDTFIYRPILEEGVYAEILMEAPDLRLGITKNRVCSSPDQSAWYNNTIVYRNYNGQILRYNTVVTTTATFTVGDIIGILLDETAGIVTFYKNGAFIYTVNL